MLRHAAEQSIPLLQIGDCEVLAGVLPKFVLSLTIVAGSFVWHKTAENARDSYSSKLRNTS